MAQHLGDQRPAGPRPGIAGLEDGIRETGKRPWWDSVNGAIL